MQTHRERYIQLFEAIQFIAEANNDRLSLELKHFPPKEQRAEAISLVAGTLLSRIREDANRELQFLKIVDFTENDLSYSDDAIRDSAISVLSAIAKNSKLMPIYTFDRKMFVLKDCQSARKLLQVDLIKDYCDKNGIELVGSNPAYTDLYDLIIPSDDAISTALTLHNTYFYRDKFNTFLVKMRLAPDLQGSPEVMIAPEKIYRKNTDPDFMLNVIENILSLNPATIFTSNQQRTGKPGYRKQVMDKCIEIDPTFTKNRAKRAWESLREPYRR